jgi:hypothetical protein
MPHLSASALEEDPLGCALLLQVLQGAGQRSRTENSADVADPAGTSLVQPVLLAPVGATPVAAPDRHRRRRPPGPARSPRIKQSA